LAADGGDDFCGAHIPGVLAGNDDESACSRGILPDGLADRDGQAQGLGAVLGCHHGFVAVLARRLMKDCSSAASGSDLSIGNGFDGDAGRATLPAELSGLVHVVERQVGVVLEDADLAEPVLADPACRDVGDAAVLELDAGIGDVLGGAQYGDAGGVHGLHRGVGEPEDDVQIVNHEVEDHADLGAARAGHFRAVAGRGRGGWPR
jgi:hypothetical protein